MILSNNYYYFQSALSKEFCKKIIDFAFSEKNKIKPALTGILRPPENEVTLEELKEINKIRTSSIRFLDEPWITNTITPYVMEANKEANWNFQFSQYEKAQFTIYDNNEFYDWHCDTSDTPFEDGTIRKLSVTVSLNDGLEYEGGEFEIDNRNNFHEKNIHKLDMIRNVGSLVVFPSFLYHRVKPVTKGTRYSLVIWYSGRPFI
jgi:PKHD-type hydroxylase|tara:strand:+ start:1182 stop:1793 length:612 start_codon:yes stop_codon:yes gene_type:complete